MDSESTPAASSYIDSAARSPGGRGFSGSGVASKSITPLAVRDNCHLARTSQREVEVTYLEFKQKSIQDTHMSRLTILTGSGTTFIFTEQ